MGFIELFIVGHSYNLHWITDRCQYAKIQRCWTVKNLVCFSADFALQYDIFSTAMNGIIESSAKPMHSLSEVWDVCLWSDVVFSLYFHYNPHLATICHRDGASIWQYSTNTHTITQWGHARARRPGSNFQLKNTI